MSRTGRHSAKIQFPCRRCGSLLESTTTQSGSEAKCPTCGQTVVVPMLDPRTGIALDPPGARNDVERTPMHAYAAAGANAPRIITLNGGDQAIVCPRCEGASPMTAHRCEACGLPFTIEGAMQFASGSPDVLDYTCLACGIVAALTIACYIGFLPAGMAIVLGAAAMRRDRYDRRLGARWPVYVGVTTAVGAIAFGVVRILMP